MSGKLNLAFGVHILLNIDAVCLQITVTQINAASSIVGGVLISVVTNISTNTLIHILADLSGECMISNGRCSQNITASVQLFNFRRRVAVKIITYGDILCNFGRTVHKC